MDEHRAKPDGGAVHEHEFARRAHAAQAAQVAEHVLRHLAAVAAACPPVSRARSSISGP